jgi:hypothetical protein
MGRGKEISELKASSERVGKLDRSIDLLLDKYGNIIDGRHRLAVDENWPKVKLEHVETDKQLLIARLVSNVRRRFVSFEEKSKMLAQLGKYTLKRGSSFTGMSYRWVMKYIPAKYKARAGTRKPSDMLPFYESKGSDVLNLYKSKSQKTKSKVACLATQEYEQLLLEPKERILKVKNYNNTDFVNLSHRETIPRET